MYMQISMIPFSFSFGRSSSSVSNVNGLSATGYISQPNILYMTRECKTYFLHQTNLIIWIIVLLKVGVGQGLFNADAFVRIEC